MTNEFTPEQLEEMKDKFSAVQLACCAGSRQFLDKEVVFGGVGISFLTVAISKLLYTPSVILMTEAGYVGFAGITSMNSPADNAGAVGATLHQGLFDMFRDMQAGLVNAACLGLAQIDKYGNANVTYVAPDVRMNGSGGGGDISCSAGRVVYVIKYASRTFQEKLDYMTNPGYLDGGSNAREKAGLVGGGPACIVSDRGIFRFDKTSREMVLAEVFPWQDEADIEEIKSDVPWDLKIAPELKIIAPPSEQEMAAIELMDPGKRYLEDDIVKRPASAIMLSGRSDLTAYRDLGAIFREKTEEAKKHLL